MRQYRAAMTSRVEIANADVLMSVPELQIYSIMNVSKRLSGKRKNFSIKPASAILNG